LNTLFIDKAQSNISDPNTAQKQMGSKPNDEPDVGYQKKGNEKVIYSPGGKNPKGIVEQKVV
jgi:hypothetical protein